MANKNKNHLPPSRELRIADAGYFSPLEQIAFDIYKGDAGTLANSMVKLELTVELKRSHAVEGFKRLLRQKLEADGYIVVSDLDHIAEDWHEAEAVGEADNLVYLNDYRTPDFPPEAA